MVPYPIETHEGRYLLSRQSAGWFVYWINTRNATGPERQGPFFTEADAIDAAVNHTMTRWEEA